MPICKTRNCDRETWSPYVGDHCLKHEKQRLAKEAQPAPRKAARKAAEKKEDSDG